MAAGTQIMLLHELDPANHGCEFGKMFQPGMTPPDLLSKGIYSSIAAPFHPGGHREVRRLHRSHSRRRGTRWLALSRARCVRLAPGLRR